MLRQAPTTEFFTALKNSLPSDRISDAENVYLMEPRDLYHGKAACLIRPKTTAEVASVVKLCDQYRVGIIPYAGGTGLVGGQVADIDPVPILLSVERMDKTRSIDIENNTLTVEAGAILENIQNIADQNDRLFPLSLAAQGSCRIGGNLATNAGGVQVLRYGNARDLCLGIEAVLPNGSIYNGLSGLRKDNTGYDVRNLLIGSEGSLGVITAATLKMFPKPKEIATAMVVVPNPKAAIALLEVVQSSLDGLTSAFELISGHGLRFLADKIPDIRQAFSPIPKWCVLIEAGGGEGANLNERLQSALEVVFEKDLISDALIAQNKQQSQDFWLLRESIPLANKMVGAISSHDISLPISAIPEFIQKGHSLIESIGDFRINCFGHLGDGNLHYNVFPSISAVSQPKVKQEIKKAVYDLVHEMNGSFSAEHGIGRLKIDDLTRYSDPAKLTLIQNIKKAIDPKGIMNPGVIVDCNF